jgi:hypothetical protein
VTTDAAPQRPYEQAVGLLVEWLRSALKAEQSNTVKARRKYLRDVSKQLSSIADRVEFGPYWLAVESIERNDAIAAASAATSPKGG